MAIEFKCQNCQKTLRVADEFAGKKARCPNCQTVLLVENDTEIIEPISVQPAAPPAPQPQTQTSAFGRTGLPGASHFGNSNPYSTPSAQGRSRGEPHRGGLVLGLGIGAIACNVCMVPGILALVFGLKDLKAMQEGRMDKEGHGLTLAGTIMGGIMTGIAAIFVLLYAVMFLIAIVAGP